LAALTSTVSLLEVVSAYFVDEKGWSRKNAVLLFGLMIFIIGIPSALSFSVLSGFTLFDKSFFDLTEFLSSNLMLPIGGFFISIFVGWIWDFEKVIENIKPGAEKIFMKYSWIFIGWKLILKYLAPVLIFIVLLSSIGII